MCPIGRNVRVHVIGNKTMHVQVMLKSTKPKLRVKIIHQNDIEHEHLDANIHIKEVDTNNTLSSYTLHAYLHFECIIINISKIE